MLLLRRFDLNTDLLFLAFISFSPFSFLMSLFMSLHSVFPTAPWLYVRNGRRESFRSALRSAEIKSAKSVGLPAIFYDLGLKLGKEGRDELGERRDAQSQHRPEGTTVPSPGPSLGTMTLESPCQHQEFTPPAASSFPG